MSIEIGRKYIFNYLWSQDDQGYTEHSGEVVEVIRQMTLEEVEEDCQPMYLIKANDGWMGHCDPHELNLEECICSHTDSFCPIHNGKGIEE